MAEALDSGADDFMSAPLDLKLFLNKLRAFVRRCTGKKTSQRLVFGPLVVDPATLQARCNDEDLKLTQSEFKILKLLVAEGAGPVLRIENIQDALSGAATSKRTIDVHICSIRKKLKHHGIRIETIRGVGYRITG